MVDMVLLQLPVASCVHMLLVYIFKFLSHMLRQIHVAQAVLCYSLITCSLQLYDGGFFVLLPCSASSCNLAIVFYSLGLCMPEVHILVLYVIMTYCRFSCSSHDFG